MHVHEGRTMMQQERHLLCGLSYSWERAGDTNCSVLMAQNRLEATKRTMCSAAQSMPSDPQGISSRRRFFVARVYTSLRFRCSRHTISKALSDVTFCCVVFFI